MTYNGETLIVYIHCLSQCKCGSNCDTLGIHSEVKKKKLLFSKLSTANDDTPNFFNHTMFQLNQQYSIQQMV